MAPTRSGGGSVPKRRGRPPGSRNSTSSTKQVLKQKSAKNRTGRMRKSRTQEEHTELSKSAKKNKVRNPKEGEHSSVARKRKRISQGRNTTPDDELDELAQVQPTSGHHPRVGEKKSKVPQKVVDRWPMAKQDMVRQIDIELKNTKNNVVNEQRSEGDVARATEVLDRLIYKIRRRVSEARVPPATKDFNFNLEKLQQRSAQLTRKRDTELDMGRLLKEEEKRQKELVEKEQKSLEDFKRWTDDWGKTWKQQDRNTELHPLLQELEDVKPDGDGPEGIGLKPLRTSDEALNTLESVADVELAPLLKQLRRSLENLQGNHAQVLGIEVGMARAQAALDSALFKHTSAQQYSAL